MRGNLITKLLSNSLGKRNPQLNLEGSERRVLRIANDDLMNYLKFHWKLVGEENQPRLMAKLSEYFYENRGELEEFVDLWSGIWLKKWNERVKLILESKDLGRWNKTGRLLDKGEPLWRQLENRDEVKDLIIESLIKHGEICGTSILAEDMLKAEIGLSVEKRDYEWEDERLLSVVNNVLGKVREVSRKRGPLIFIKVNKSFFDFL
jgi:hypothetical protein